MLGPAPSPPPASSSHDAPPTSESEDKMSRALRLVPLRLSWAARQTVSQRARSQYKCGHSAHSKPDRESAEQPDMAPTKRQTSTFHSTSKKKAEQAGKTYYSNVRTPPSSSMNFRPCLRTCRSASCPRLDIEGLVVALPISQKMLKGTSSSTALLRKRQSFDLLLDRLGGPGTI